MGEVRPGDWECPKCGDNQFARNIECRKCGEPKPRDLDTGRRDDRRDDFGGGRRYPVDTDGREFCGDFKRGNCFREYCRFSHGGASQERERGGDRGGGGRGGYDDRDRGRCDRDRGRDRYDDRRDRSRDRRRRGDSRRRRDSRRRDSRSRDRRRR
mmetsp:Transcript_45235/g.135239  ORF Transcript_45235/g.135239 Transcript_45235/m.135239 type:complete len:155 (+) Transcript_45235:119-583(+)